MRAWLMAGAVASTIAATFQLLTMFYGTVFERHTFADGRTGPSLPWSHWIAMAPPYILFLILGIVSINQLWPVANMGAGSALARTAVALPFAICLVTVAGNVIFLLTIRLRVSIFGDGSPM